MVSRDEKDGPLSCFLLGLQLLEKCQELTVYLWVKPIQELSKYSSCTGTAVHGLLCSQSTLPSILPKEGSWSGFLRRKNSLYPPKTQTVNHCKRNLKAITKAKTARGKTNWIF
jgi:hypothetical protein